mgnify:CR=1 FL=1
MGSKKRRAKKRNKKKGEAECSSAGKELIFHRIQHSVSAFGLVPVPIARASTKGRPRTPTKRYEEVDGVRKEKERLTAAVQSWKGHEVHLAAVNHSFLSMRGLTRPEVRNFGIAAVDQRLFPDSTASYFLTDFPSNCIWFGSTVRFRGHVYGLTKRDRLPKAQASL